MRKPLHDNLQLAAGQTALLVIDLQEEQRSDPDYYTAEITRVLAHAARLLAAARAGGWPVAHARYVRDFTIEPPRPFEPTTPDGTAAFSDAHAGQTDICPEVAPRASEPVFIKNDASAFARTGLQDWIDASGIQWLMVCGVWTEACVAATVRDAVAAGLRVLLVKDACASGSRFMHETAILNLANRLYGGAICDTDRATTLLAGLPAPVWRMVDPVPLRFDAHTTTPLYDSL